MMEEPPPFMRLPGTLYPQRKSWYAGITGTMEA